MTVSVLVITGCGDDDDSGGDGDRLSVVASFYPLAEAAERVGGDAVEVINLTPAGVEPHDLELSPDQVDQLEDADLVLYLGEGFQPAVAEVAERRDGPTVDLLADLELDGDDPHFWLDPTLLADAADLVAAALADAAPDLASSWRANADAYRGVLDDLDGAFQSGLTGCERDDIVTSHEAFHYLAERYGLTQVSVAGLSPESEPDPDRIAELSDLIEAEGITTVFYETLVSDDVAVTLAREAGVATAVLNPIEGLTDDELDAGADYESIMRTNLAALRAALGCP